jgi:hypothetical protein
MLFCLFFKKRTGRVTICGRGGCCSLKKNKKIESLGTGNKDEKKKLRTHTHTHELFLNSSRTQSREEKRTGSPPPPPIDNMSIKNMILKYKEIR